MFSGNYAAGLYKHIGSRVHCYQGTPGINAVKFFTLEVQKLGYWFEMSTKRNSMMNSKTTSRILVED